MPINLHKGSHIVFFVGVLGLLSIGVAYLFQLVFPKLPFGVENISPLFAYGLFYGLFDKYLWQLKIFQHLGIVIFPNLNGRWSGSHTSEFKNINRENTVAEAKLEIMQTFSSIKVYAYYKKSESVSAVANFADFNGDVYLYYTYDSDPNSLRDGTMARHKGTVKIKYLKSENRLKGSYFNSLKNEGGIDLSFESKELKGYF